jgi:subfamily B ATP-binding cassette protein MsbA
MKSRTSIVIAHRLSTIQHTDKIIVLHEGEIVETGTHNQLIAANKHYKTLYDLQDFS